MTALPIVERLRRVREDGRHPLGRTHANPDGPEAADMLEALYEALGIAADLIGGPTSFAGLSSDDEVEHTVRVRIDDVLRIRAALTRARSAGEAK